MVSAHTSGGGRREPGGAAGGAESRVGRRGGGRREPGGAAGGPAFDQKGKAGHYRVGEGTADRYKVWRTIRTERTIGWARTQRIATRCGVL